MNTRHPPLHRHTRLVLLWAAVWVAVGLLGSWTSPAGSPWLPWWDNLHWTASCLAGAALAWLGQHQMSQRHARGGWWMALGLSVYALGQLVWDLQVYTGLTLFPAPSDALYLWLGPLVAVGLVRVLQAHTLPSQRRAAWIDTLLLAMALTVLLLALYLPSRGDTPLLPLLVLLAYPIGQLVPVSLLVVMVLTLRLRPTQGLWYLLGGLSLICLSWMHWNYLALNGQTYDGAWFNGLFSAGSIAMGFSLVRWRVERHTSPQWERRCEGVLRQLPLVCMLLVASAVLLIHTVPNVDEGIRFTAEIGAGLVVLLAMLRQAVLLREHDQLKATQASLLRSQRELAHERGLLRSLVRTMPDLVWLKNPKGAYLSCNVRFERFYGVKEADILGKTDHDFFDTDVANAFERSDHATVFMDKSHTETRWLRSVTGEIHGYFDIIKTPAHDPQGRLIGVLGIARDITATRQAQEELQVAAVAFESQQPTVVTDAHGVILKVNRAFTENTGYTAQECVGQTPGLLASGRHNEAFYAAMWTTIHQAGGWQGEVWDKRKNGEVYPKWLTISAVNNAHGEVTHYIGIHHDITERKKAEEQINTLAFYDQLTGLPNRTLLMDRMRQATASSAREGSHCALLFIDLDHFKTLNDTHGHSAGDALLQQVATRLGQGVRAQDTVARLGGDEFVLMLLGLGADQAEAASHAETIATQLLLDITQPYALGDITHRCTASVGVSLFQGQHTPLADVMRQADLAMYRAKAAGRNAVRFFDPDMEAAVLRRAALESDLRLAVEQGQFVLHYQPQVDALRQVYGAEALVRWVHPQRGMVSPGEFIPLAEETGLILPLGLWVLETACAQLAQWARLPTRSHLRVSVNVSAHQFQQRDFVSQVLGVLARTGAPPQRLKLELTESMLVANVDDTIRKMRELKAHGVGFSLDDFGTGFSSLTYLKRLPLDQLKIDQSFVRDVLHDANDAAIARTIVALAHSLGLDVVAEGVETQAQRDFLQSVGCGLFQGYLFARPQPVDRFEAWLQQGSATHAPSPSPELAT
jgi:diguanylate cyclase (GGDEF)-like protein/PAS domain S-box-containing protein